MKSELKITQEMLIESGAVISDGSATAKEIYKLRQKGYTIDTVKAKDRQFGDIRTIYVLR